MKRYKLDEIECGFATRKEMIERINGDYVLYSEAAALLAEKETLLDGSVEETRQAWLVIKQINDKLNAQKADNHRLRELVESAYAEGFEAGARSHLSILGIGIYWASSISAQALAATAQNGKCMTCDKPNGSICSQEECSQHHNKPAQEGEMKP